jgi:hypothetical protein
MLKVRGLDTNPGVMRKRMPLSTRLKLLYVVFITIGGCGEPFEIAHPAVERGQLTFLYCQSPWSCGQEWPRGLHVLVMHERSDGTPVREVLWEFTVDSSLHEITLPDAMDDCIFRYSRQSVQPLKPLRRRRCGRN